MHAATSVPLVSSGHVMGLLHAAAAWQRAVSICLQVLTPTALDPHALVMAATSAPIRAHVAPALERPRISAYAWPIVAWAYYVGARPINFAVMLLVPCSRRWSWRLAWGRAFAPSRTC